jgi:energy-coupling factor transporter ATP-binding protein EcfA2
MFTVHVFHTPLNSGLATSLPGQLGTACRIAVQPFGQAYGNPSPRNLGAVRSLHRDECKKMRIKKIRLRQFKRFDDLTIDLGDEPKKIVALVGPNGCGKSSVFDAFEEKLKDYRNYGHEGNDFLSKAMYYDKEDESVQIAPYNKNNAITIEGQTGSIGRKSFYIRTAYRFTSKLNVTQLQATPKILETRDEPISSIALDSRLQSNYQRLLGASYTEFFKGDKTGTQVRAELLGKINGILSQIIEVEISDLGDILASRGQLYFKKGNSLNFPYANLSSGEKEVVDIIIDLLIKTQEYNETVICIDEPELHLNTAIQRKLLIEIEKLIPDSCQLWVATHSIGFLRALQEELKGKSQIIDFSYRDYFTGEQTVVPMVPSRSNWQRIFATALEDLTGLLSPRRIVYCEGRAEPARSGSERGFDAKVFNNIFSDKHNDTLFVSSGGNTELDQRSEIALAILSKVFEDVEVLVLKDRDISSGRLTSAEDRERYLRNHPSHHRVLERWEIENYLFDKEVLKKYCAIEGLNFDEASYDQFFTDIINQDVKAECARVRNICGINTSINPEVFKLNLSKIISEDMSLYAKLERCIFIGEIRSI